MPSPRSTEQSKPKIKPSALLLSDEELQRQAAELDSFRRILTASQGIFSLSFAVCTNRTLRDGLIGQLCAEFPGIELIGLPADTISVYRTVAERLAGRQPVAIFITDLEPLLPFDAEDQPVLAGLNLSREQWENFHCPVVFWLAEYAATLIASKAVDFWRYRSHHFEFDSAGAAPDQGMLESFGGQDLVAGLPYEQKRFRMAELEQRLEAASPELRPHIVSWTYELAELYQIFGQYDRAEELLRQLLTDEEQTHGLESPEVAVALNNIAFFRQNTSRMAEAEPLMRRALDIDTQSFGDQHPIVAHDLNDLAQVLQATNRLGEAEPLMRRALAIDVQSLGDQHRNVARDLNNLARLLNATNRFAEAEPLMHRALAILEKSFGNQHPYVANGLNNMAGLLCSTNRLAEAEPLLRRALTICEASLGPDHPNTQITAENYRSLLDEMRK